MTLGGVDGSPGARKVLLAEDDEINQDIVREILRDRPDIALTVVADGREAMRRCMTERFDLLIIDRRMPGISGEKLIRHIRASANFNAAVPIILFSATPAADLASLPVVRLANEVLSKPISRNGFLEAIERLLPVTEERAG